MYRAGAYCRLSKEDGDKETSDSIANQKSLITQYAEKNGLEIVGFFIDDGVSGLTTERPGLTRLMEAIDSGAINAVITKDMSRLGRDRLETGRYIEKIFPLKRVRYISILDGIDTLTGANIDIAPFKGLMDEHYAKDISKKVRGAFDAKRANGEFIGAFAPYGYNKDALDKNKLVIDEEAAATVKRIFGMFIGGTPKLTIARTLNKEGLPCPSEYKRRNGLNYINHNRTATHWTYATISKILTNEVYIGHMAQKKSETVFKSNGKKLAVERERWIVVPNAHTPVIDAETFETARKLMSVKTRRTAASSSIALFAGILYCADCGKAMSKTRHGNAVYYKCGTYKAQGKAACSAHTVREDALCVAVLGAIRNEASALTEIDLRKLRDTAKPSEKQSLTGAVKETERRIERIGGYRKRLYEDYCDKILDKQEYQELKESYSEEEAALKDWLKELSASAAANCAQAKDAAEYIDRFIQYIDIDRLSRVIIVEMLERIEVAEDKKIHIVFRFASPLR